MPTLAKLIENNELGEICVQPVATRARRKPIPAKSVVIDARDAVLAFLGEMAPVVDYEFMAFTAWHTSYRSMRAENGWPPLSEKSLSQAMQVVGCPRKKVEARRRGRGRYIAFRIPEAMQVAA